MTKEISITGKKVAKKFRKADQILITKTEEGWYWVSDTYAMFHLNHKQYMEFRFKWSGYKANPIIEDMKENKTTIKIRNDNCQFVDKSPFDSILPDFRKADLSVEVTNFFEKTEDEKKYDRLMKIENGKGVGMINNKYYELIKDMKINKVVTKGLNNAFVFYIGGELQAVIMPVRYKTKKDDPTLVDDLKSLVGVA